MIKLFVCGFRPCKLLLIFCFLLICFSAQAQTIKIDTNAFGDDSRHWYNIAEPTNIINPKPNQPKFKATDLIEVGDNILLYQKNNGGWPKNYDMLAMLNQVQKDSLLNAKNILNTTFDNGTSYTHVACLATVFTATKLERLKPLL